MLEIRVPVIASFDRTGNVLPLYVRINEESFKILSCKKRLPQNAWSAPDFECKILNHGYMRYIYLTFDEKTSTWRIKEHY